MSSRNKDVRRQLCVVELRRAARSRSVPSSWTNACRIARAVWRPLASTILAVLLVALFSGGACVVVYCTEDCDPCFVQTCKCNTCVHAHADFDASHRLDVYELTWVVDSEARVTGIYANILGLSLDRALGVEPHGDDEMVKFARDVLAVNAELLHLGKSAGRWVLDGIERFESSRIVSFHESIGGEGASDSGAARATLLFDGRGNLIEIDHTLR